MTSNSASCLINGKQTDSIHVTDRGLQFGDGVFETIRIYQGKAVWWSQHMERLLSGCERLGFIELPDIDVLSEEMNNLVSTCSTGVLKIIITRGCSSSGYAVPAEIKPNRILMLTPGSRHKSNAEQGISLGLCSQQLAARDSLHGIKHLNRLEQVIARAQCIAEGWDEGIMMDQEENVIEGTMSNLFVWQNGKLLTPSIDKTGIKGLCREIILSLAIKNGFEVEVTSLKLDNIQKCDGVFITNSLIGLWPVTRYQKRHMGIQSETRILQKQLEYSICSAD